MILIWGALLGFISVAFGAYTEHGLYKYVSDEHFRFLMTALRYNQTNAVIISGLGLILLNGGNISHFSSIRWSAILFTIGTILFSFSIYLSVVFKIPFLMNLTPLGGVTIMAAWLMLLTAGVLGIKRL